MNPLVLTVLVVFVRGFSLLSEPLFAGGGIDHKNMAEHHK